MISMIDYTFNENVGYFKVELSNGERLLLTRREFLGLKTTDTLNDTLLESTNGNFYNPFTKEGNEFYFKLR